jgi:hypothetical protein
MAEGGPVWVVRRAAELYRDFGYREASGSLGDLGTFIPLLVGRG